MTEPTREQVELWLGGTLEWRDRPANYDICDKDDLNALCRSWLSQEKELRRLRAENEKLKQFDFTKPLPYPRDE